MTNVQFLHIHVHVYNKKVVTQIKIKGARRAISLIRKYIR